MHLAPPVARAEVTGGLAEPGMGVLGHRGRSGDVASPRGPVVGLPRNALGGVGLRRSGIVGWLGLTRAPGPAAGRDALVGVALGEALGVC